MKIELPKIEDEEEAVEWAKRQFPVNTPHEENDMCFMSITEMVAVMAGDREFYLNGDMEYLREKIE